MPWSWTPVRSIDPELMDAPGLPESEVAQAYQVLRRVNRQLGNLRSLGRELQRFLDEEPRDGRPVSILDVGSGSGDLPQALQTRLERQRIPNRVLGLDRDPTAVALAHRQSPSQSLDIIQGDALRLPFADGSIDLVTAVKFAHHFHADGLTRLISEMARVAGRRVIVLDIQRHWLAYWGFIAWSRLLTRNRLVRYDGPLSVLRGFTADELTDLGRRLPSFSWTVRTYAGFQLALVGRRIASR
ncbi:methyltransferase domain-containing protein [Singulisphaera acidiphila]|uniref:Methylase involved in ubiquinone/menaquinone biosynthesis n=1 Tax=Singulisphaera acidiphila (strain ATCC BAA-1392 / DSM 18658 / VKM B-2454 / MOB10) TaxID=886293 RepID=L0DRW1_SINAD|nr:methyltransferase domain-containing protein [Singulisphaera acidiphila]AGA31131.1 methylase involved in ubiquinone/menaquinone biosynthesis [Singulisphaera acidiphila DSM 18658]